MIGILMMALIIMVATSQGAIFIGNQISSVKDMMDIMKEKRNKEKNELIITHAMKPYGTGGELIPPIDTSSTVTINGKSYLGLPDQISTSKTNTWGIPYVYCPVSGDTKGITSVGSEQNISFGDSNYSVVTYNDGVSQTEYVKESSLVLDSSLTSRGLVAIIMSIRPGSNVPDCGDIYLNNGNLEFLSGSNFQALLTAITKSDIANNFGIGATHISSSMYSGSATLENLTSSYAATQPAIFTLGLDDNLDRAMNSDLTYTNKTGEKTNFVIQGEGASQTNITSSDLRTITFNNLNVTLKNVSFGPNISFELNNSHVTLDNSSINSGVALFRSDLNLGLGSEIHSNSSSPALYALMSNISATKENASIKNSGSGEALELINSSLMIDGVTLGLTGEGAGLTPVVEMKGDANITVINAGVSEITGHSLSGKSLLNVGPNASFRLIDSSIVATTEAATAIKVGGSLTLENSTSTFMSDVTEGYQVNGGKVKMIGSAIQQSGIMDTGIALESGSTLHLANTSLGDSLYKPTIGVTDNGAISVEGTGSDIYASSSCFTGYLFDSLDTPSNSTPLASSIQKSNNKSNWTCH